MTPAETAAGTAMLNASLRAATDPSVFSMSRDLLDGSFTLGDLGLFDMTGDGEYLFVVVERMLTANGIDVERMRDHFWRLTEREVVNTFATLGLPA